MKNYRLVGPDNQTVLHMLCAYSNVYSHIVCVEMWIMQELVEGLILGSAHKLCVKLFLFNK